jgi:hypothetical protein
MNYRCARCGAPTHWDEDLGKRPICVTCWDKSIDTGTNRRSRAFNYNLKADRSTSRRPLHPAIPALPIFAFLSVILIFYL